MRHLYIKRWVGALVALVVLGFSQAAWAKVNVVTTLPDFAALAKSVGGEHVEVEALVRHNEDPHYVDAKPSFILKLNKADLLILNGLGLEEGWLPPLLLKARNTKIQPNASGYMDMSAYMELLQVPTQRIDRAQGDIHPGGNPHFAFDPRRMSKAAFVIAQRLSQLDPEHKAQFEENAKKLQRELDNLMIQTRKRFLALPKHQRQIITYHQSLIYLNDWLALDEVATIEPKPGIPPNPGHVAQVLKVMKANKVGVILQESFYQQKTSKTLAQLGGAKLVVIQGGARFSEGQSYVAHIKSLTESLYAALNP